MNDEVGERKECRTLDVQRPTLNIERRGEIVRIPNDQAGCLGGGIIVRKPKGYERERKKIFNILNAKWGRRGLTALVPCAASPKGKVARKKRRKDLLHRDMVKKMRRGDGDYTHGKRLRGEMGWCGRKKYRWANPEYRNHLGGRLCSCHLRDYSLS